METVIIAILACIMSVLGATAFGWTRTIARSRHSYLLQVIMISSMAAFLVLTWMASAVLISLSLH